MKKILLIYIIFILYYPIKGFTQPIKIPVIPYNKRTNSVPIRIHNKCKSIVNYSNCVKRYVRNY